MALNRGAAAPAAAGNPQPAAVRPTAAEKFDGGKGSD